jgi:putative transposase
VAVPENGDRPARQEDYRLGTVIFDKCRKHQYQRLPDGLCNRPTVNNSSIISLSDRGIQYTCGEFVREIDNYESITISMSGKGNCWDNAVAENFFKTLKVELIYQNRFQNKHEAESSISECIEKFYNTNRRHRHLEN